LFKVRMLRNKRVQLVQIRTAVWGVELPNQGGYYEAIPDPPLWAVTSATSERMGIKTISKNFLEKKEQMRKLYNNSRKIL